MGVEGIDTRTLTKHIRVAGAMRAMLSTEDVDPRSLVQKAKASPGLIGRDLVREVTCAAPYAWDRSTDPRFLEVNLPPPAPSRRFKVIVMDFGVKYNILRSLRDWNCEVIVLPASASAEAVLSHSPDGILLSNGPGDPEGVTYGIETVRQLLGRRPIFAICRQQ